MHLRKSFQGRLLLATFLSLFPVHPKESEVVGENATGIVAKKQYFLPGDAKKTTALCAVTHGDGKGECIVGEYVKRIKWQANRFFKESSEDYIADEEKAKIACRAHKDLGIFSKDDNLKALSRWVTYSKRYATEEDAINNTNGVLGQEELPTSVKNQLSSQSLKNPMKFLDPNKGVVVEIIFDSSKDPADMYKVLSLEDEDDNIVKTALSDEDLDWFVGIEKPATVSLRNCYTEDSFNKAIEGLEKFDKAHSEYNLFADSGFLDKCEEISKYWSADDKVTDGGDDLPF